MGFFISNSQCVFIASQWLLLNESIPKVMYFSAYLTKVKVYWLQQYQQLLENSFLQVGGGQVGKDIQDQVPVFYLAVLTQTPREIILPDITWMDNSDSNLDAIFYCETQSSQTIRFYLPAPRVEDRPGGMFFSEGQDKVQEFIENSDLGQTPRDSVELGSHLHSFFCEPNPACVHTSSRKLSLMSPDQRTGLFLGQRSKIRLGTNSETHCTQPGFPCHGRPGISLVPQTFSLFFSSCYQKIFDKVLYQTSLLIFLIVMQCLSDIVKYLWLVFLDFTNIENSS